MANPGKKAGNQRMVPALYDFVLWTLSVLIDLFFREVHPRGAWKVPKTGPVILVAAPHANQVRLPMHQAIIRTQRLTQAVRGQSDPDAYPER